MHQRSTKVSNNASDVRPSLPLATYVSMIRKIRPTVGQCWHRNCLKHTSDPITCRGCEMTTYCNHKCRKSDAPYHINFCIWKNMEHRLKIQETCPVKTIVPEPTRRRVNQPKMQRKLYHEFNHWDGTKWLYSDAYPNTVGEQMAYRRSLHIAKETSESLHSLLADFCSSSSLPDDNDLRDMKNRLS